MTSPDLTRNAREIVESYGKSDWTGMKNLLAPDVVYNEFGTQRQIQGPDQIIKAFQEWKKAMTDTSGTVTNAFAEGNRVVVEIKWQGTNNGPFTGPAGTMQPTGKHQTTPAAMVVAFQGDKAKEINHYFDMVTFLTQIGAMPAPART